MVLLNSTQKLESDDFPDFKAFNLSDFRVLKALSPAITDPFFL